MSEREGVVFKERLDATAASAVSSSSSSSASTTGPVKEKQAASSGDKDGRPLKGTNFEVVPRGGTLSGTGSAARHVRMLVNSQSTFAKYATDAEIVQQVDLAFDADNTKVVFSTITMHDIPWSSRPEEPALGCIEFASVEGLIGLDTKEADVITTRTSTQIQHSKFTFSLFIVNRFQRHQDPVVVPESAPVPQPSKKRRRKRD